MRASSAFASSTSQRSVIRSPTARAGPGFYTPLISASFSRYEGPAASPSIRQPLRDIPSSPQMRKTQTRYASTAPRLARLPNVGFPGPGHYSLERYSQFSLTQATERCQPFELQGSRSSIRDVYPDRRNLIMCRAQTTPAPNAYAPVPHLDRLRMSMRNPPCAGRIRAMRGCNLDGMLRSSANLSSTLQALR